MRWIAKAAAFKVLSAVPGGGAAYHLIQDHVTRTTVVDDGSVAHRLGLGGFYLDWLGDLDPRRIHHVDLGAGWLPTIPFQFFGWGVERQTLVDVACHMDLSKLADLARAFRRVVAEDPDLSRRCRRIPPEPEPGTTLDRYLEGLGMRYVAPYTLAELRGQQADVVTCTGVLLHLPEPSIRALLDALREGLRPGGRFMAYVPLHDIYAGFDPSISPFNKWRYAPFVWDRLVNSRLMSFNRLTASDYGALLDRAGLEVIRLETPRPDPGHVRMLERTRLHRDFAGRPPEEFLPSWLLVVAQRRT